MKNIIEQLQQVRDLAINIEPAIKQYLSTWDSFDTDSMLPCILLLPLSRVEEKHIKLASAFLFLQVSRNCHSKITNNQDTANLSAVLYGDLFYSHAYRIIESEKNQTILNEVAEIMIKSNEAWFYLLDLKSKESFTFKEYEPIINDELGLFLNLAAEKGWDESSNPSSEKIIYQKCVKKIGLLWGAKIHKFPLDTLTIISEIITLADKIHLKNEIKIIVNKL